MCIRDREGTDTAIYVIGRNAGEGADRSATTKKTTATIDGKQVEFEVGDYELTETEKANLALVGKNFDKVIVVLNVGGVIDTKFMNEIEGLDALVNICLLYTSYEGSDYTVVDQEANPRYTKAPSGNNTTPSQLIEPYEETIQYVEKTKENPTLLDVYQGTVTMEELLASLSVEEMSYIVEGLGWGGGSEPVVGCLLYTSRCV